MTVLGEFLQNYCNFCSIKYHKLDTSPHNNGELQTDACILQINKPNMCVAHLFTPTQLHRSNDHFAVILVLFKSCEL